MSRIRAALVVVFTLVSSSAIAFADEDGPGSSAPYGTGGGHRAVVVADDDGPSNGGGYGGGHIVVEEDPDSGPGPGVGGGYGPTQ